MSEAAEAPAGGGGGWKKIAGIVVVVALIAAGGGFWWSTKAAQSAEAHAEEDAPKPRRRNASKGLIKFEPFVVNLADGAGSRFLRANLQLVIEPAEAVEEVEKNTVLMMQARSALLELLAQQSASALVTPDGKAAMKEAILKRAQDVLEDWTIADVLFSEFVVQF
jgi:flagellar basal body-associated protein FliL